MKKLKVSVETGQLQSAYLKDVLKRLPTNKNHLIAELLPHRWQPLRA